MKKFREWVNAHTGRDEAGFSLLELVVAVGIILVLAVAGFIGYQGITQNARYAAVESSAAQVYTASQLAGVSGKSLRTVEDEWNGSSDSIRVGIGVVDWDICVVAEYIGYDLRAYKGSCSENESVRDEGGIWFDGGQSAHSGDGDGWDTATSSTTDGRTGGNNGTNNPGTGGNDGTGGNGSENGGNDGTGNENDGTGGGAGTCDATGYGNEVVQSDDQMSGGVWITPDDALHTGLIAEVPEEGADPYYVSACADVVRITDRTSGEVIGEAQKPSSRAWLDEGNGILLWFYNITIPLQVAEIEGRLATIEIVAPNGSVFSYELQEIVRYWDGYYEARGVSGVDGSIFFTTTGETVGA